MSLDPPLKTWSFSSLKDFEACPYRVYLDQVQRVPREEESDDPAHPLQRGNRVHKEAEDFIQGLGPLTKDLRKFEPELERMRESFEAGTVEVEQQWGYTGDWCTTTWFESDCQLRVKCDVVEHLDLTTVRITDWKTGKSMGNEVKHRQQAQLYAVAGMLRYPKVVGAEAVMAYTDEGKSVAKTYTRDSLTPLLAGWTRRAAKMLGAVTFSPKPNRGNCRFCRHRSIEDGGNGACPYAASQTR